MESSVAASTEEFGPAFRDETLSRSGAVVSSVDEAGSFTPPLVLLSGRIRFPFDQVETLKAMIAAVMVLGSAIGPGVTGLFIDLGLGLETQFLWISGYFLLATALMFIGITRARA